MLSKFLKTLRNTKAHYIVLFVAFIVSGYVYLENYKAARVLILGLGIFLLMLGRKHPDWGQILVGGKVRRIIFFAIPILVFLALLFRELVDF